MEKLAGIMQTLRPLDYSIMTDKNYMFLTGLNERGRVGKMLHSIGDYMLDVYLVWTS